MRHVFEQCLDVRPCGQPDAGCGFLSLVVFHLGKHRVRQCPVEFAEGILGPVVAAHDCPGLDNSVREAVTAL